MWTKIQAMMLVTIFVAWPSGLAGQQLQPGDSVRFGFAWQNPDGRVTGSTPERHRWTGTVVSVDADSLTVREGTEERRFAFAELDDLRAWESVENPRGRAFKKGAIIGGLVGGATGFWFGVCSPRIGMGTARGCSGSEGAGWVAGLTASGAALGALQFGIIGALFARDHRWRSVSITPLRSDGSAALTVRLPVRE